MLVADAGPAFDSKAISRGRSGPALVGVIRIRQRRCLIMDTHAHHQGHEDLSAQQSRYRRAQPPKSPRLGRWQQVLAEALDQNLCAKPARRNPVISLSLSSGMK